ncbi:unannotated protein [freshwater metagenome]|uniref:Unannotated protein n=1 Tax=freshwater metagenome TaxID=449393 RepID=A0A6J6XI47_9ZZZZ
MFVIVIVVMFVIVIVFFFDLALGLGLAAAGNAFAASFSSSASTRDATTCSFTFTQLLKIVCRQTAHDDRDVAGALTNTSRTATGTGTPPLKGRAFVSEACGNEQFVGRNLVVVLGVGDSRLETLKNDATDVALSKFEHLKCSGYRKSADEIENLTGLIRR